MDQESIVYGCIKDPGDQQFDEDARMRRRTNREVMMALPSAEDWPFLAREMFALPADEHDSSAYQTEVMHFGASYKAVEYEWDQWIAKFEEMLRQMYWVSATVHLETELSGTHTFTWESRHSYHKPNSGDMSVRCEWSQEGALY
jgi:hypothetical protein